MVRKEAAHPVFLQLQESLDFLLKTKYSHLEFSKPAIAKIKQISQQHNLSSPTTSLAPFYLDIIGFVGKECASLELTDEIRTLFRPSLGLYVENAPAYSATSGDEDSSAVAAETVGGEDEDLPIGRRANRRRTNEKGVAAGVAPALKKVNLKTSEMVSKLSSQCLVKTVPEGYTVYSSLPVDLNDKDEYELDEDVTVMEIVPTSYSNVKNSAKPTNLKDISPAIVRPSHLTRAPPLYRKRKEEMNVPNLLDFGPFSSFAPKYDSSDSEIGYDQLMDHYISALIVNSGSYEILTGGHRPTPIAPEYEGLDLWTAMRPAHCIPKQEENTKKNSEDQMDVDSGEDQTVEQEEGNTKIKEELGPKEAFEYLKSQGIDLDKIAEELEKPPSEEELEVLLDDILKDLDLLSGLQHDRVESADLNIRDFVGTFSLTVPMKSHSINPNFDNKDLTMLNVTGKKSTRIEMMLKPWRAEQKVYRDAVQKLIKCTSLVPVKELARIPAIRKLMNSRTYEEFEHRGALPTPNSNNSSANVQMAQAYPMGVSPGGYIPSPGGHLNVPQMGMGFGFTGPGAVRPMMPAPQPGMFPMAMGGAIRPPQNLSQQNIMAFAQQQQQRVSRTSVGSSLNQ